MIFGAFTTLRGLRAMMRSASLKCSSARAAAWKPQPPHATRGYLSLFLNEATQADEGCDFRFLHHDGEAAEPAIH